MKNFIKEIEKINEEVWKEYENVYAMCSHEHPEYDPRAIEKLAELRELGERLVDIITSF